MKVLLVSAPIEEPHRGQDTPDNHYPLGLAYLHAVVEEAGYEVDTMFANHLSCDRFMTRLRAIADLPDVFGFNVMSHNRVATYRAIEYLHENYPEVDVILGGVHATVMYEQILEKYPWVTVVLGEGERTFVEYLARPFPDEVDGIAYVENTGNIAVNPERELIKDLNTLPFPKHELFVNQPGRTLAGMLTSRGCPSACNFCVLDKMGRRRVRYRSPESVVAEIKHLQSLNPNLDTIWFHDDAFTLNIERAIDICMLIVEEGIQLRLVCSARFKPISEELIQWMEKAGFIHILFGLESGSDSVMKKIGKGVSKNDIRKAMQMLAESSIKVTSFLIVGLPGETEGTIQETINFVQELQGFCYMYYDDVGVCMVYPGTRVYEESGLSDDFWLSDAPVPFYNAEHDDKWLFAQKEWMRDHISLPRMFEAGKDGLERQGHLLDQIIKYSFKFGLHGIQQLAF